MATNKGKVLVMGGTGAMGTYLVPELANKGFKVDVLSLDDVKSTNPLITYTKANALDASFMESFLKNKYDAIVDFMVYNTNTFKQRYEMLLSNTDQYFLLSSCRVFDNVVGAITEKSPRLLDVSRDRDFLATEDYALYKAREEDMLKGSHFRNWTITRPVVTYSKRRYQLASLEAAEVVRRAKLGLTTVLPEEALHAEATMAWGGDVAKMFAGLVLNEKALCNDFNLTTSEHHTWETVAGYYEELIGLKYISVDTKTFLGFYGNADWKRYQLKYGRLVDKIYDNTKILEATGLSQADLMPLKDGLAHELATIPADFNWSENDVNKKMDEYLATLAK